MSQQETRDETTTATNPAQVTDARDADKVPTWPSLKKALWRVLMDEKLNDGHYIKAFDLIDKLYTAAIAAGGEAVASIVPEGCTGKVLVFDPGALHVNKDGSGYIVVDEDDWQLEDDRCGGPDGPEGSVHWITRLDASEMQALRDFLNGVSQPHPADERVVEALREALAREWTNFCDANPDDLTSPEDLPDHALMTCEQFVEYAMFALSAKEGR